MPKCHHIHIAEYIHTTLNSQHIASDAECSLNTRSSVIGQLLSKVIGKHQVPSIQCGYILVGVCH